jgi:hypothetical protein
MKLRGDIRFRMANKIEDKMIHGKEFFQIDELKEEGKGIKREDAE